MVPEAQTAWTTLVTVKLGDIFSSALGMLVIVCSSITFVGGY